MSTPRILLAVLVFACAGSAFPAGRIDETPFGLEELKAIATQWRESFVNLRIVYELRILAPTDAPLTDWQPPADVESLQKFAEGEWIWADHGLDLFETRAFYWQPGTTGVRTVDIFNGPEGLTMRAGYRQPPESPEVFKELMIERAIGGKPTSTKSRAPLAGLYSPATAKWLSDMLSSGNWEHRGDESILGSRCIKLRVEMDRGFEELWLDPDHSALPRRHRNERVSSGGSRAAVDFVVDEFEQLDGGLWFPKRGRIQIEVDGNVSENQLFLVNEADINIPIDLRRFQPPEPSPGTAVVDGRTGQSFVHGVTDAQRSGTFEDQDSGDSPDGTVSSSALSGRFVWVISGLVCLSAAFFVIGIVTWYNRFRSSS